MEKKFTFLFAYQCLHCYSTNDFIVINRCIAGFFIDVRLSGTDIFLFYNSYRSLQNDSFKYSYKQDSPMSNLSNCHMVIVN